MKALKLAWILPKKYIPSSVVRNRLKRWGRDNLRKIFLEGWILVIFLKRDKSFYKSLKRKDFDNVLGHILEKIQSRP